MQVWFQSTRPRGARNSQRGWHFGDIVSIHAPTRGAKSPPKKASSANSFNPRAHAGREESLGLKAQRSEFQSTRPRGARTNLNDTTHKPLVSIHAPTRGANLKSRFLVSNPSFQSTRPRGARNCFGFAISGILCFNPRAHAGRECRMLTAWNTRVVSIHAPTRGANGSIP